MGLTEVLLVVAVVGGIIAVLYPTFRGAAAEARAEDSEGGAPGGRESEAERARRDLEERRRAVLESLEEIDADRDAGNLSQADYERQRRRYEREAAAVLRELEALRPAAPAPARKRAQAKAAGAAEKSRVPAIAGWLAIGIAFGGLAMLALSGTVGPREGGVMTGSLPGAEQPRSSGAGGAPEESGSALVPVDPRRLAELEIQVAADSSDVAALVELGDLYLALQRFDRVARVSMKALATDSTNPWALTNLGMVLVAAGHEADAMEAFDRALERDPDFHRALLFKGIVAFQNRDFEEAIRSWEHYLRVAPDEANTRRVEAMLEGARVAASGQPAQ